MARRWLCSIEVSLATIFGIYIVLSAVLSKIVVDVFSLDPLLYLIGFVSQFIFITILLNIYEKHMFTFFEEAFIACLISAVSMAVGMFVGLSFVAGFSLSFALFGLAIYIDDRLEDRCV